jgi:hypothetical protein
MSGAIANPTVQDIRLHHCTKSPGLMVFNLSGSIAGVPICLPTCFFRQIILFAKIAIVFPTLCSGKQFLIFEGGLIEIDD